MKCLKITIIIALLFNAVYAQVSMNTRRIADVYFENKEYYAAAEYYKKLLQVSPDSLGFVIPYGFEQKMKNANTKKDDYEYAVYQLANSLRLYHNYRDAENWYAIAAGFDNPKYIKSSLWYGQSLRTNLKFEQAIVAFESFIAKYKTDDDLTALAKLEIASCKYALNEITYPRLVNVAKITNNINKEGSNYAPALSSGQFYFTSSRPTTAGDKDQVLKGSAGMFKVAKKPTPYLNTIYKVEGNNILSDKVEVKKVDINLSKMETAATSVHPNGKMMFLTAWTSGDQLSKKNIFISKKEGDKWSEPVAAGAEINVVGFNAMQPSVTIDGRYLIFSSDRPGGQGGYDLWFAPVRADGTFGNALNMGKVINTNKDEQAGYYIAATSKLLFSSNGRVGLGGFDFYEASGAFAEWSEPVNLGFPFNSAKDDMYFAQLDSDGRVGYISSDRESVCCLEVFKVSREYFIVDGEIVDCKTKKPIPDVIVTIKGPEVEEQVVKTDENGLYTLRLESNRGLEINISKDNYFSKNMVYSYKDLVKSDTLFTTSACIEPMVINKPIVLNNILYEFNSFELTDSSKITLDTLHKIMVDNPTIEIELGAHTDNIGTSTYNLDLSDRRAKSCVDYLVSKGIGIERMTWRGYGFFNPIAPNKLANGKDNPEGRALNRRTEFKVTKRN
jgi:OOP family OmpA-OmpF porin